MSFTLEQYAGLRPYLYHVVAKRNLAPLRRSQVLYSAAAVAGLAHNCELVSDRRLRSTAAKVPFGSVLLRDQAPLYIGNIAFEPGWDVHGLLVELAGRIFFWPGSAVGPIGYGRRHFRKYASTDNLLRVPFTAVERYGPQFCRFNSGSPRCSRGRKSPRGASTFLDAGSCPFGRADVVEVVFRGALPLPEGVEWSTGLDGPWRPFIEGGKTTGWR